VLRFLLVSLLFADAPAPDDNHCVPLPASELSATGTYQNQQYVFVITLDGKPLPDESEQKPDPKKLVACSLTS
jgi:hypothetical protein